MALVAMKGASLLQHAGAKLLGSSRQHVLCLRTLHVHARCAVEGQKLLGFGKHAGLTYEQVVAQYPEYGAWVLEAAAKPNGNQSSTALKDFASYLEASAGGGMQCWERRQAKSETEDIEHSQLTQEQAGTAVRALAGESLFLTGAAGTGKSFLLRYIIQELVKQHPTQVAITASTGIAAANIGGQTLHSFAGIGLGYSKVEKLVSNIEKNPDASGRWKQAKVLIVDEISMLHGSIFGKLEEIARRVRRSKAPFGGLQLLICGDFLQLPPVSDLEDQDRLFSFQTDAWKRCGLDRGVVLLKESIRQSSDPGFAAVLNELRVGKVSWETQRAIMACHRDKKPPPPDDGIIPTKLYCFNRAVDKDNNMQLDKLDGEAVVFKAADTWVTAPENESQKQTLVDTLNKRVPKQLRLKKGAQVILIKNCTPHLVNGSRGKVVEFRRNEPLVRFDTGELVRVRKELFEVQGAKGTKLQRSQLPLKLGWALTVHKAQGLTLSRAELEVDCAFDYGQTYVALSRLTGLDGLWISGRGINRSRTRADPEALKFYQQATEARQKL